MNDDYKKVEVTAVSKTHILFKERYFQEGDCIFDGDVTRITLGPAVNRDETCFKVKFVYGCPATSSRFFIDSEKMVEQFINQ